MPNDIFNEEDEDSIFTDEPEDIVLDEDLELASMGLIPALFIEFRKKYPSKNIFYPKIKASNLTKYAFKWYIANCSLEKLENIERNKLPEGFEELIGVKFTRSTVQPTEEDEDITVAMYINKNSELIKENTTLKKLIIAMKPFKHYTRFLYNLMGDKTLLKTTQVQCPECKEVYYLSEDEDDLLTDDDYEMINVIDEVLK